MPSPLAYRFAIGCYFVTRIALRALFLGSRERRNAFLNKHKIRPSTFFLGTSLITRGGITAYARRNSDDFELLFFPREPAIQKYVNAIRDGEVFVDVGSNVGYYALKVKGANPNSRVIAVEAHPETYQALVRNVGANKFDIVCINKAVYKSKGNITFYEHGGWSGIGSIYKKSEKTLSVEADTLDSILSNLGVRADFIKIDIEGAELDALQGAFESLKNPRLIIVEIHNDNLIPVSQTLEKSGFNITIENNGEFVIGIKNTG